MFRSCDCTSEEANDAGLPGPSQKEEPDPLAGTRLFSIVPMNWLPGNPVGPSVADQMSSTRTPFGANLRVVDNNGSCCEIPFALANKGIRFVKVDRDADDM